jgi:hypothetical protein
MAQGTLKSLQEGKNSRASTEPRFLMAPQLEHAIKDRPMSLSGLNRSTQGQSEFEDWSCWFARQASGFNEALRRWERSHAVW